MRPRLLLTYPRLTSFVRDDIALLSERYDVRTFAFEIAPGASTLERARALVRLAAAQRRWLRAEARGAAAIVSWFADYHAVLPVRTGRAVGTPTAIIVGGYDANYLPELDYGVYGSRWRAPLARYALRHTDLLLPVSATLIASQPRFATWPEPRPQGVMAHVPGLVKPHAVVPTGYEPEAWPLGLGERGATVCTVGVLTSERTLRLKGIDLLIATARCMPDVHFQVVGLPEAQQADVRRTFAPPPNVDLLGLQPREKLAPIYGQSSVYLQLSRTEGLPNVVCEAMLCGCIPVGSRVGGIPDAIGEAGEIVDVPEPEQIADAVRSALGRGPSARQAAREHVLRHYSRDRRRRDLFAALDALRAD